MAAKDLAFESDARNALLAGVEKLANAVKSTLGPRGRCAIIDKGWGGPTVTKDGVTVAKEIELEDPVENMGAQMVREVASKTSDVAGDGTTTATVLAQAMVREGLKAGILDGVPIKTNPGNAAAGVNQPGPRPVLEPVAGGRPGAAPRPAPAPEAEPPPLAHDSTPPMLLYVRPLYFFFLGKF